MAIEWCSGFKHGHRGSTNWGQGFPHQSWRSYSSQVQWLQSVVALKEVDSVWLINEFQPFYPNKSVFAVVFISQFAFFCSSAIIWPGSGLLGHYLWQLTLLILVLRHNSLVLKSDFISNTEIQDSFCVWCIIQSQNHASKPSGSSATLRYQTFMSHSNQVDFTRTECKYSSREEAHLQNISSNGRWKSCKTLIQ